MGGQIHSGLPWTQGPAPVIGDGWVQFGGTGGKKIFLDQLSKADQDLIIQYLLSAQFPVLAPPQVSPVSSDHNQVASVGGSAALKLDQARHDIITAMLDSWLDSIQKTAEQSKRSAEKKVIEKLNIAYQEFKRQDAIESDGNFPLFVVGLIIVGTGIHQAVLPDPTLGTVQMNPVVSMYNQVAVPVMGDMRAELGLIGAMFSAGIKYFTVAQAAAEASGDKLKDGAFAKGYAENIIGLISSASFNQYLAAIVIRSTPKGQTLDPKRAEELVAMVKIILLSSALAMLYQVEAGKMKGAEFAGMLNRTIAFPETDIRSRLVDLIKAHLKLMNPSDKEKTIAALLQYFDGDPSIDSLADPSKVFAGLYEALPRGELSG